MKFIKIW